MDFLVYFYKCKVKIEVWDTTLDSSVTKQEIVFTYAGAKVKFSSIVIFSQLLPVYPLKIKFSFEEKQDFILSLYNVSLRLSEQEQWNKDNESGKTSYISTTKKLHVNIKWKCKYPLIKIMIIHREKGCSFTKLTRKSFYEWKRYWNKHIHQKKKRSRIAPKQFSLLSTPACFITHTQKKKAKRVELKGFNPF